MSSGTVTWKPVPGFPGYEASLDGEVRSYYRKQKIPGVAGDKTTWEIVRDIPPRILGSVDKPRLPIILYDEHGKRHQLPIYHVVLITFVGQRPGGMECCHADGNPANNAVSNLRWDTRRNNILDIPRKERRAMAARAAQNRTLVDDSTFQEIMHRLNNGAVGRHLAQEFGVSESTISKWKTGKRRSSNSESAK